MSSIDSELSRQFIIFDNAMFKGALDTKFYHYCLVRQISLIKHWWVRFFYNFLHGIGIVNDEVYYSKRWYFLREVKQLETKLQRFWRGKVKGFSYVPKRGKSVLISRQPEVVIKPIAMRLMSAYVANKYNLELGKFTDFSGYEELYRDAVKSASPSEIIDGARQSLSVGVKQRYVSNNKVFDSLAAARQNSFFTSVLTFAAVVVASIVLGVGSLYFAPVPDYRHEIFLDYFKSVQTLALNIAPVVLTVLLLFYLTNRTWLAFLLGATVIFVPTWYNYFKLIFRNDPLYASDIMFLKESQNMASKYGITLNSTLVITVVAVIIIAAVFAGLIKGKVRYGLSRAAGIVVIICAVLIGANVYKSEAVYNQLGNYTYVSQWSDTGKYVTRGFVYPFLHSFKNVSAEEPEGYKEESVVKRLAKYKEADIPDVKKVNFVIVMLEAFNDFSKFEGIEFSEDPYEALHILEAKSLHGELMSNVFAGGTVDTEWAVLSGYPMEEKGIRTNINSYVRFLKSQGYFAEGSHPGYAWFYNRANVNEYLGFDRYWFFENYYEPFGSPDLVGIAKDEALFEEIRTLYEQHISKSSDPYFSFNVTYQNHGPYDADVKWNPVEYVSHNGLSDESYNIINNYLAGIADTAEKVNAMAEYFAGRTEPVVYIVFGDHNPWLGNNNSVYTELGITFEGDSAFTDYYGVMYNIYANDAAKSILGDDFVGVGETISPCFLLSYVFDRGGMGGDSFIQASISAMKLNPVLHESLLETYDEKGQQFVQEAYYWRHKKVETIFASSVEGGK